MWPFTRRTDDDFQREIEAHLAIEAERLIAEGLSAEEAAHAAVRTFGNRTTAQERFYESRRMLWLDELRQDVRYAWRALRRSPGFASVAVLTLALGIGANTAIFSVVNAVLLRPLPYQDPDSLVLIEPGEIGLSPGWVIPAWRERASTLSDLAGFNPLISATLVEGAEPEQIDAADITWNFFSFLGVPPVLGRDFTEADAARGAPPVAILSHELWRRRFGANPDVIGRTIKVSRASITVVGVAGSTFRFPTAGALRGSTLSVDTQPDVMRVIAGQRFLTVIGRLEDGVTPASASAELLAMYRQAGQGRFSRSLLDRTEVSVVPLRDRLAGNVSRRLWLVMGAVAFVLLVACANVANLLLARASTRQRELALRTALGARKGRLARLVLTESVLLALLGAAGALVFAASTSGVARTLLADRLPHVGAISIDWAVLAFNVAVAATTGIVCGLACVPGVAHVNLAAVFSDAGAPASTGRSLTRRVLLSTEVAVTFVLVIGAALLAQTLWNLNTKERGFDARRLLTLRVSPGLPAHVDRTDAMAGMRFFADFFGDLTRRMERLPGVASAATVSLVPLAGMGAGLGEIALEGQAPSTEDSLTSVAFVTPGYFRTMRISLLAGRDFDETDRLGAERVAIVNDAFRRRFIQDGETVGARIAAGRDVFTIVGLAEDVPDRSLREASRPLLIVPLAQMPGGQVAWGQLTLVLQAQTGDPRPLAALARREIWSIDPNIVIDEIATMDERVAMTVRAERDSALLFGLFALTALAMAAIGVYGVAAYAIAQRTKEIGIRVALGAARRDVRALVISQTLTPTLIGIGIGIAGAAVATRVVASMVYGVTPLDPATFGGAALVLVSVALAATWLPARRAMRIDPLVALRYE